MKKIILSVAALSAALAQAQVGINEEKPKATLDISVKKDNIDNESQEGLLIPRVTKEKALKMANNSTAPEESVLIYVNDVANYTSAPDEKVNDITEKGYYFWNGTKWVKSSGANGELWAQRQNGSITETYLKPALANNDFVGYNSNRKYQLNLGQVTDADGITGGYRFYKAGQIPYSVAISSDVLPLSGELGQPNNPGGKEFGQYFFAQNTNVIRENHVANSTTPNNYYEGFTATLASKDVTSPMTGMEAFIVRADHHSNSDLKEVNSIVAFTEVGARDMTYTPNVLRQRGLIARVRNYGGIVNSSIGLDVDIYNKGTINSMKGISLGISSQAMDENDTYPAHTIQTMRGVDNRVTVSDNADVTGDIFGESSNTIISENVTMAEARRVFGDYNEVRVGSNISKSDVYVKRNTFNFTHDNSSARNVFLNHAIMNSTGLNSSIANNMYGFYFWNAQPANWSAEKMYGVYLDEIVNGNSENYGLYIKNVGKSGATANYAIYTNKGNVRFGDLANSTGENRVVVANGEGVLSTQDISGLGSLWAQRDVNSVKETYLKEADAQNDFVGYRNNHQFGIKLGAENINESQWDWEPGVKGFAFDEVPFWNVATSDALPLASTVGYDNKNYNFSSNRFVLKANHINNATPNNGNKIYVGNSFSFASDINNNTISEDIDLLAGINNLSTVNFSGSEISNIQAFRNVSSVQGDAIAKNNVGIYNMARNYGTSKNMYGISTEARNYGEATNMTGITTLVTSRFKESTGDVPAHTLETIRGIRNRVLVSDNANVTGDVFGSSSSTSISENVTMAEARRVFGNYNEVTVGSNISQSDVYVKRNIFNFTKENSGARNVFLNHAIINASGANSSVANSVYGFYMWNAQPANWTSDKMYGVYLDEITNGNSENYGLYIKNVGKSGASANYAIYTNNGDIRFGQLTGAGERIVTADADGVLKTSTTSLSDLESLWKKDASTSSIVLKENSAGAPRVNSGVRNDVTIDDSGKITAKGFIGYNGATIFPDYVFEKYYTGESTIKADYNFHNLASVESFIKTNGHLPGYQSAKEIASKGLIDLGATQLTNVEKIEELYLHTIEQEKKIEQQSKEIEELKSLVKQLLNK